MITIDQLTVLRITVTYKHAVQHYAKEPTERHTRAQKVLQICKLVTDSRLIKCIHGYADSTVLTWFGALGPTG